MRRGVKDQKEEAERGKIQKKEYRQILERKRRDKRN